VWRYLDLGRQGPFDNGAQMPVLTRQVGAGSGPVVTTSVWGSTHLNVGWFDDVDATLDLDACRRLGVEVIRRPIYGGGTAFYAAECSAMWAFLMPRDEAPGLDDQLARFQPVLLAALRRLGLGDVRFEGSSDLRWHGRKLGALAAQHVRSCASVGGFLNLRRPDLDLYLQVVRVPEEKFRDKPVSGLREYVATAEDLTGEPLAYETFRDALVAAVGDAGIELCPSELSDEERAGVEKVATAMRADGFVRRVSSERFRADAPPGTRVGFGNVKGRQLCRAGVAVDDDGVVVAALLAGDMHVSPPDVLDRVAARVVGTAASDGDGLRAHVAEVFEAPDVSQADAVMGVTTDDLLGALLRAVAAAA
jgi:lipoate-protein ligase A